MKRYLYFLITVVFICFVFAGCISSRDIEELQDDVEELEEEIEEYKSENAELSSDMEDLEADRNEGQVYNDELEQQVVKISSKPKGEFPLSFEEYFAQLIYLSLYWEMDMFEAPQKMHSSDSNTINYAFFLYYGDSDTTSSNFEIHIETDPESEKVISCTVVIVQDEQYRGKGDAYTIGYQGITEIALSALILAMQEPYNPREITFDLLEGIQSNDPKMCSEYNIRFELYDDLECEARIFIPNE